MLSERLLQDLKQAMRNKDAVRLRTIRSLRAAIQSKEIELRGSESPTLDEEQIVAVLQKQAKQRRDAIEQFEKAGRDDLVATENEELTIIQEYLPKQLEDSEIRRVVEEIVEATGATEMRDMGKVMGAAMKKLKGKADGKRINAMVREALGAKN